MQSAPLLSFVIPVYNAESTLSGCLDSILQQPGQNFEIILVDDASTDQSQRIIDRYAAAYPSIVKAFSKKNGGPGDTRNYGIRHSGGLYVTFVDSDDTLTPDYGEVVTGMLVEHAPDIAVIGYNRMYNRRKNIFERSYTFSKWTAFDTPVNVSTHPELICKIEGAAWLKIIKRTLLTTDESLLFARGRIGEDLEASLKWYLRADKIVVTGHPVYNYHIRPHSLNAVADNLAQFIEVQEAVCGHYRERGKFEACFAELECVFAKHLLISSMLRLRSSAVAGKYAVFRALRAALMQYFPRFHRNKYLRAEPLYVRLALYLAYKFPAVFRLIL